MEKMKNILIICDSIPTESYKRSGVFAFDDYDFLLKKGYNVKLVILYRITYSRGNLFQLQKQYKTNRLQISEINKAVKKNPDLELIPYYSLIKPFVFKEDLFIIKNSRFKKEKFDVVIVHSMLHTGLNIDWIRKQFSKS